ncbi:MAG: Rpn family recombination-promoting nuclease/putative transposase [Spirochaetota bacterium]|jgi:predicted transposase/invertase (TIGR01784 family)|nr:Rpn family recombination-promoting nuclease/putative transposase [Spirochaetota bacterium]
MTKLDYTLTDDMLFKMVFVRHPDLLIRLVAALLDIRVESIEQFIITNSEIPPNALGDKFCRLDINMMVSGQCVDLEIQVKDEHDYPERSLYYWAREYSSILKENQKYRGLPRTIIISIVAFDLFDCPEFYSEFQALEVKRHTRLTDKMRLCYFELSKLPDIVDAHDELKLWLKLFKAKTEEDLRQIKALGVPIMEQAIQAYRQTKAADEFRELERLRSRARHNEASALYHAAEVEREKWQAVVAEKDTVIAEEKASHAAALAEKDKMLAENAALIAELRARLGEDA